ncbi:MAG: tetraacyldisaccharide 4'-kinase [Deltaproteobacteria bacterium]|nr:tetraacyldisaccharide 4'-kinase [Deltaproteobacteria bacterium]MDH4122046.1 tetraacyldisaccharide 4'-kinase [Deltaproteobacteria bacterium]
MLWPLGVLYGGLVRLRNALYSFGLLPVERLGVPVISVGNLTAGGTGKTPVVRHLARTVEAFGIKSAVISRGYRRRGADRVSRALEREGALADPARLGDEPAMLAKGDPNLPVYVSSRRAEAGRLALLWDRPGLLLLDDGFQHRALARDLNLLLVDGSREFGGGRLLPCGWLREPLGALVRADAIVCTKSGPDTAKRVKAVLAGLGLERPVFTFGWQALQLRRLDGKETRPPESLAGRQVNLVCALAQPQGVARTVEGLGARVARLEAFPDHDPYGPGAVSQLNGWLQEPPGEETGPLWLTTEKDGVKLAGRLKTPERLWVLDMAVTTGADWETFFQAWLKRLPPKPAESHNNDL